MEFKNKLETIVMHGAISMSVLMAKEVGIFDILKEAEGPLTSQQVADAKKLKERYVREVLHTLTSACLVQISSNDNGETTFFLKEDAKKAIDKGLLAGVAVMKGFMPNYLPTQKCFPLSGPKGHLYGEEVYTFFDELDKGGRTNSRINWILDNIPGLKERLEQGINVIEFGCGTGHLSYSFATRFPKSTFTASEINDSLEATVKNAWGEVPNMRFATFDILHMSESPPSKFDLIITADVIHDLPHPLVAMKNLRKWIINEDGGAWAMLDFAGSDSIAADVGNDYRAFLYTLSTFFCIPESYQVEDSEAHGAGWGEQTAVSMLQEAGFDVKVTRVRGDDAVFHCQCKKEAT